MNNRDEIRRALIVQARQKKTITYADLFANYGADMDDTSHRNEVGKLLYHIGEEEYNNQHPLLTAIVIRKDINMPGPGFFDFANEFGFAIGKDSDDEEKEKFFKKHLKKTYDFWSKNKAQL